MCAPEPSGFFGVELTVTDAFGEHDEGGGKAVSAEVRSLPGAIPRDLMERIVESAAILRATTVAFPVAADERDRAILLGSRLMVLGVEEAGEPEIKELFGACQVEANTPLFPWAGLGHEEAHAPVAGLLLADKLKAASRRPF